MKCKFCTRQATVGPFENAPDLRLCEVCEKVFRYAFDFGYEEGKRWGLIKAKTIQQEMLDKRRKKK